jgi:hypothetical protein
VSGLNLIMKAFHCDACGSLVFFENISCVKCGHDLGFLPEVRDLSALEPDGGEAFRALSAAARNRRYHLCLNGQQYQVCNWMVPVDSSDSLCLACQLNRVIPDLSRNGNLELWHKLELAKRRIIYRLLQLGLPLTGTSDQARPGLAFQFLADPPNGTPVISGHARGLITVNLAEADDPERERRRIILHEPYRTLLGHLRHEIAHYYWDRLVADSRWLSDFRALFGDERQDYAASLQTHYHHGPPADWQARYVSAYATSHPWEDWAETWAHYFHILDLTETAGSFGMSLRPEHPSAETMTTEPAREADLANFDCLLAHWFPLTYALNTLNRDMGSPDLYPFALSEPAIHKLRFMHEVVRENRPEHRRNEPPLVVAGSAPRGR